MAGPIYLHDGDAIGIGTSVSSGCVGIGTTDSSKTLRVNGTVQIDNELTLNGSYPAKYSSTPTIDDDLEIPPKGYVDSKMTTESGWTRTGTVVHLTNSSDNVGIGTTSTDGSKMKVYNNDICLLLGVNTSTGSNAGGLLVKSNTTNTSSYAYVSTRWNTTTSRWEDKFWVENGDGIVYCKGDIECENLDVSGSLYASVKSFQIDHPLKKTRKLTYGCLEGPEMSVLYRGKERLKNGKCVVKLPSYFEKLTKKNNRSIHLNCINGWSKITCNGKISRNQFQVFLVDDGGKKNQEFWWTVQAQRNDQILSKLSGVNKDKSMDVEFTPSLKH